MPEQPVRVQRKRTKGFNLQAASPNGLPVVYVGRPTMWGNPFHVGLYYSYSRTGWLTNVPPHPPDAHMRLVQDASMAVEMFRDYHQHLMFPPSYSGLRGSNLACWCPLCDRHRDGKPLLERCSDCAPCHVDPLGELIYA